MDPGAAIDNKIEKWSDEDRRLYRIRLKYTLRCLKFLLHQGLAFRGHDESEESSNRGKFIELLKFLAANSKEVDKYVLKNAVAEPPELNRLKFANHGRKATLIQLAQILSVSRVNSQLKPRIARIFSSKHSHEGEHREYNNIHFIHHRVLQRKTFITNQF